MRLCRNSVVAVINYTQDFGAISFLYCTFLVERMQNLLFRLWCIVCSLNRCKKLEESSLGF